MSEKPTGMERGPEASSEQQEDPELTQALTGFANDSEKNEDLRSRGHDDLIYPSKHLRTLVEKGGEKAEAAIIAEYEKSDLRSESSHLNLIKALGELAEKDHPKAAAVLVENFKEKSIGGLDKEASALIKALGKVRTPEASAALQESYEKGELNFPKIAIRAMGENGDPGFEAILKKEAQTGAFRIEALEALGNLKELGSGAIELLKQALWDNDAKVKKIAADGLYNHSAGVTILEKLAQDDTIDEKIRGLATERTKSGRSVGGPFAHKRRFETSK